MSSNNKESYLSERDFYDALEWPEWPRYRPEILQLLEQVLQNGRWTVSGPFVSAPLFEREFASIFASYCGVPYCVPTDHGSSALLIALESLDIGFGDEVILPALTWVANITAVVNINAIPVLVDVDPTTLCLNPDEVKKAITNRTKAIFPVHLYSGMANMDDILNISEKNGIPIVEDCSHAHGAKWRNNVAGSLGLLGAFSMQQSKLLPSGEGGAVITKDPRLFKRLQQLRADSRIYVNPPIEKGELEIVTLGEVQGTNYCLSEFHAAILLAQLKHLDDDNNLRLKNSYILDQLLRKIEGLEPLSTYPEVTQRAYYAYVVRINLNNFGSLSIDDLKNELSKKLKLPVERIYPPLNCLMSYSPATKRRYHISQEYLESINLNNVKMPVAERAYKECLCFPHWVLLSSSNHMQAIAQAFREIQKAYNKF